jgi:hypothetical protein
MAEAGTKSRSMSAGFARHGEGRPAIRHGRAVPDQGRPERASRPQAHATTALATTASRATGIRGASLGPPPCTDRSGGEEHGRRCRPLPLRRRVRHSRELTAQAHPVEVRQAQGFVDLHHADQDPGARREAHQHRLGQEAHEPGASDQGQRHANQACQQRQRRQDRQPLGA